MPTKVSKRTTGKVLNQMDDLEFLSDALLATLANVDNTTKVAEGELLTEVELSAAKAFIGRGKYEYAMSMLSRAADHAPSDTLKGQVADQLLALAKALVKIGDSELPLQVEQLLRLALALAPGRAAGPLAQFLQRRGQLQEAVETWGMAIHHNPQETNNYLALARLHKQMGEPEKAQGVCLNLVGSVPSAKNTLIVSGLLDELALQLPKGRPNQTAKVALLGNATLDHLQSYLKVALYQSGLHPNLYLGGFGQYAMEIFDPESGLYTFAPDVLVLAIHPSQLFPNLHHFPFDMTIDQRRAEIDAGLESMRSLIEAFTRRSSALVLVHNMVVPQHPALGTLDLRDEFGQAAMFAEINLRLADMLRSQFKNAYIVDEDGVQSLHGKAQATDARLWYTARLPWSHDILRALTHEYLRYIRPLKGLARKCIILDLDNTLWGGVIGEDGLEGIQLGSEAPGNAYVAFQREIERLWRRGILLAISSKNNQDDAIAVFEKNPNMVLKLAHFAAQRINWEPKVDSIRQLAEELNLGLDSLVFLDDNPVERAKVRAELPQVLTPELPTEPSHYRDALLALGVFDTLALTDEDRNRNKLYAEQRVRKEYEATFSNNLDEFLAGLKMTVDIAPATSLTLPRLAQLTNKTNQFNLTTKRYNEAQISEMQARGSLVFGMNVTDRFGDNGLVGLAIVVPRSYDAWEIDTFLMSCRVMGRGVETALMAAVCQLLREHEAKTLEGWYIPTAKNAPVKDFYPSHGFIVKDQISDGSIQYSFDIRGGELAAPKWLSVHIKWPSEMTWQAQ